MVGPVGPQVSAGAVWGGQSPTLRLTQPLASGRPGFKSQRRMLGVRVRGDQTLNSPVPPPPHLKMAVITEHASEGFYED